MKSKWCPEAGAFALDGIVYVEKQDGKHDSGQCISWDGAKCSTLLAYTCKSDEPKTLTEERK